MILLKKSLPTPHPFSTRGETVDHYRIFASRTEPGVIHDGSCIVWELGCDGTRHADTLTREWHDLEGKVTFADWITTIERGPCDNSCTSANLGGFLYQPSSSRSNG